MKAIRWIGFQSNSFVNDIPKDLSLGHLGRISDEDALHWESCPHREICVEIMDDEIGSFCQMQDAMGLIIDMENTTLIRVYAEDGWTTMKDGCIRSTCVDESVGQGTNWSDRWEDIESVYHSIPTEERETWCEAIVSNPRYIGWIACEDCSVEESLIQEIFGDIPQVEIQFAWEN